MVAGNVTVAKARELSEKWFGPIPSGIKYERNIPAEPRQTEARRLDMYADVPLNALYKAYHMPARDDENYHAADLVSDILGRGKSSRLYDKLVKEQKLFNSISASVMGSMEPGLLIIQGKLNEGVDLETANRAIEIINADFMMTSGFRKWSLPK